MRSAIALGALATLALLPAQPAQARGAGGSATVGATKVVSRAQTGIGFWAGESVPGTDWDVPGTYWRRRSTQLYTPYLWRVLSRYRIPLYLNLRYRRDFGPVPPGKPHRHDGLSLIRRANRHDVPVWAWVLIPYSDGYWAWEGAASEQFKAVRSLVHWAREKRVRLGGIALDPEPPLHTPFETTAAIMGGGTDPAFPSLFAQTIDPAAQCAAWNVYARIPDWVERHNLGIVAAPMPAALDDIEDHRLALQDAAQFVLPEAPWDRLFFQAYRSVLAYYSGHDPGSGIVSSYLRSARRNFGDIGQISLGSAGRGSYRRLASLVHDVRLAATLGARHVPIYSLERTLRAYGGPRSVVRLAQAALHPFTGPDRARASAATPQAEALRAAVRNSDAATATATPAITGARGAAQPPNAWPDGCG